MSHMPANNNTPKPKSTGMSRWWPLSFFLIAIALFIVGGALIGVFVSSTSNCLNDSNYGDSYSYTYTYDNFDCTSNYNGEFYGAVACFIIGGVCKLIAWVLLIMYCVRRRRSHQEAAAQYHTVPMGPYTVPGPYGQPQYPPQYPQGPHPMYPDTAYHGQAPVSKEPMAAAQYA